MKALSRLIITELRLYLRDFQTIFWSLLFPAVMIILFGQVFRSPASAVGGQPSYLSFFIPGLLALSAASVAFFSIAVEVAGYRDQGIYRRLRVTPVRTIHLVLGHILPALVLVLASIAIVLVLAGLLYDYQAAGSWLEVVGAAGLSYLAFAALAFALAAVVRSGRAANSAAVALLMPMMLLSGVLFPLEVLGSGFRVLARFLPLTPSVELLRGIWLGTPGNAVANILTLAAWLAAGLLISYRYFRWE